MSAARAEAGSARRRFGYAAAFVAGLVAGLWLLSQASDFRERSQSAVQWLRETVERQRQRVKDIDGYREEVGAAHKELASLQQLLPAQFPAAEIEAGIRALAQRHGVELVRIEIGRERPRDFYASLDHVLELRGTAAGLQGFFADYADVVPLRRLGRVRLSSDGAGALLFAEVHVAYYRYIEADEAALQTQGAQPH